MTYKVCQVIFSTNRLAYLTKTLASQRLLNFDGCTVDKIFIDDFPKDRNDLLVKTIVNSFGYNEVYLHEKNQGLSVTWTEFWNLIRDRDYDYVWHQEDDVVLLEPVKVADLIELLQSDPLMSQAVLQRQPWYSNETAAVAETSDRVFKTFRIVKNSAIFSPMASLYSIDRVRFPYSQWYREYYADTNFCSINFNEGMVGKALLESCELVSATVKNSRGRNLIEHIGDYFVGKRVLPDEPHYDQFAQYDPEKRYNSKNGAAYE